MTRGRTAGFNGVNPFPVAFGPNVKFPVFADYTAMNNIQPAQVQNWNLSLQHQLPANWFVSASYVGSHTIHMLGSEQLNPSLFFPGNADANGNCFAGGFTIAAAAGTACSTTANTNLRRRLNLIDRQNTGQYVANLVEIQSGGKAGYNGMLLEIRKPAGKGVTLTANYTWSHCLALYQANEAGNTGAQPTIPNPFIGNRDAGRGNCNGDHRQVFNFTPLLSMPNFQKPALRYVASGWTLSSIYRYQTGGYIDIVAGSNNDFARNGTNVNGQRAVYAGGDPIGDHSGRPLSFWLNKDAFARPTVGTMGNTGTRSVIGPGHFDFNISLSRTFRVTEGRRLEFRWEAYNVTNSFRPFNPNFVITSAAAPTTPGAAASADVTNPLFGQIRNSDDPRIMQFALKYLF